MKRSITAMMVLLASIFYALVCQAQILGTIQLGAARRGHTATLLQDGKVLIVGGDNENGMVGAAEIFDPIALTSSSTPSNPLSLRTDHTATLVSDGRVLIIGGVDSNGLLSSTEFYNPYSVAAPSFSTGLSLQRARSGHTATVLADGKILIIGGEATGSAEIFNPATQTFSLVSGSLSTPRQFHSAALLNDGRVLIVGGVVGTNTVLTSAELYDPQTQMFTPASGMMQTPRGLALLRVLHDGKVQVIGGDGEFSMEMFDPETNSFIALAHIPPHDDYLYSILVGRTRSALITTIIQQNPMLQGAAEMTPEIIALLNRLDHTVTEIPQSNRALIAGGINDAGQILGSATIVSSSAATVTTDKFDYAPGEMVMITGRGFQPNETVWMLLHEEPETREDTVLSSVADVHGNFTNTDFAPSWLDINRNFTLTAIGQTSGFTTQTAFKDAPRIASVSVGAQAGTLTFGTAGSATFTVTSIRGNNGIVNATLSVLSGLPAGVTASFSPNPPNGAFTSTGNNAFPLRTLTLTTSATTPAGTFIFTVQVADGNDKASNTGTLIVSKAGSTTTVTCPGNVAYTGSALTPCSASVTGAGGLNQSLTVNYTNNSNAGTATASASFAGDANHNGSSDSKNFIIDKAGSITTVTCPANVTYTGSPIEPCTATVTGAGGLNQALTVTYSNNMNAGTATASASFAGDANHNDSSDSKNFIIDKAATVTTVTCGAGPFTFNGSAHTPCSASVSGPGALNEPLTVNYTDNVNAGTATASASFAETANYMSSSDAKIFEIKKAPVTATAGSGTAIYDGATKSPSACMVTGAYTGDLTCANDPVSVGPGAGTTSIIAVVSGTGLSNFDITRVDGSYTIEKAPTTTIVSCPANVTYNGAAQTPCTVSVTGAGGLNLTPSAIYSNNVNAGTAAASYTFAETENHLGSTDSKTFEIKKAPVTAAAGSGTAIYDGETKSPSACVVNGAYTGDLTCANDPALVGPGAGTTTIVPVVSGTGLSNFEITPTNGSYTINKAASVATVSCPANVTFTGSAIEPCTATVTGAGGLNQSLTVTYANNINAGTATASASYVETANHLGSSDWKNFSIDRAPSMTTVTFETGPYVYRGTSFAATAVVTGVGGLNQAVTVAYTGDCTNVTVANGCTATATFDGDINHTGSSDSRSITLIKADATILVFGYTGSYDGAPHGASGTATGVLGENLSASLNLGAPFTYVPGGTANWTFAGGTNYNDKSGSVDIVITTAFAYEGFYAPINGYGGDANSPVKAFKLGSTIPVKFGATWLNSGAAVIDGTHTLQVLKFSNSTLSAEAIDATPTDSATTGNQFRLTGTEWHFNLSTKGLTAGTWLLRATLQDGSQHTVWIAIKR